MRMSSRWTIRQARECGSSQLRSCHNNEAIGAIYLVARIENIFTQMKDINKIFATGTAIALIDYCHTWRPVSPDDHQADFGYA